MTENVLRIAGISDTHLDSQLTKKPRKGHLSYTDFQRAVEDMSEYADVIIHCGDFTDHGDQKSLRHTAAILSQATKPVIGVLGNHDIEQDPSMATEILTNESNITLLEGNSITLYPNGEPIGFVGIPGFKMFDGEMPRYINMPEEDYQDLCDKQSSRFYEELPTLTNKNNISIFHFDQMRYVPSPDDPTMEELYVSDFLEEVDNYADKINLVIHGHDHRRIERPISSPKNVEVIDVAARIQIEMHPGIPYRLIHVPIRE